GSRGIYHDGGFASAFGPFTPRRAAKGGMQKDWDSATDSWQLHDLGTDFSQATDLAAEQPAKLEELKRLFLDVAADNKDFPIGAGNWLRLHPGDVHTTSFREWTFTDQIQRMPEFTAPGLGKRSTSVRLEVESAEGSSGVLYAIGGAGGGLALYMDEGRLCYEYNMMLIERYTGRSDAPLSAGKHVIEVKTQIEKPGASGTVAIAVDGKPAFTVALTRTVPLAFSATETFDVGTDLGSPVSPAYAARKPFAFAGKLGNLTVKND
ncbi:MAG: arylsulfatase, partial [Vicinamibacterales bacterium]